MKMTPMHLLAGMLAATLNLSAWAEAPALDTPAADTTAAEATASDVPLQQERDKFFSTWEAHGNFYAVEPKKLLFQGSFEGMMFTEDGGGLMDGAEIVCAVTQEFDLTGNATQAVGKCSIDVSDEDTIYARFDCEGEPGMCDGQFTLVGGTGRFAGISGGGNYRSRTQLAELASHLGGNAVVVSAEGIAVWSDVKACLKK
jgi:hypothetical protein